MRSSSPTELARARPLLGTIVEARAAFPAGVDAEAALDAALGEVALVHALMSFQDPSSELSRINAEAALGPVQVDPRTFQVLRRAREIAEASQGVFDVVRAAAGAVAAGALPRAASPLPPDPEADWRDIELLDAPSAVRFHRPLLLDLGGIAKGYAVDLAVARLEASGAVKGCVNAGGDLRAFGPEAELVALRTNAAAGTLPVVQIADAALASSSSTPDPWRAPGLHLDGRTRAAAPAGRFVSVAAPVCMDADALTKVVMIRGAAAAPVLRRFAAAAFVLDPGEDWRTLEAAA